MLIKLTGLPHPDYDEGRSHSIYVEANSVLVIERGQTAQAKARAVERNREALKSLWEECQRVSHEVNNMPKTLNPDNEKEAAKTQRWFEVKMAADALNVAYSLVASARPEEYYPVAPCTVISLSCGTAVERGVMLSRVHVTESPDEVMAAVRAGRDWTYPTTAGWVTYPDSGEKK